MAPAFQPDLDISVAWIGFFRLQFPKDFKLELFRVQSPLLTESQLVSFPPLSYMLKFSGSSYLIWDTNKKKWDQIPISQQNCDIRTDLDKVAKRKADEIQLALYKNISIVNSFRKGNHHAIFPIDGFIRSFASFRWNFYTSDDSPFRHYKSIKNTKRPYVRFTEVLLFKRTAQLARVVFTCTQTSILPGITRKCNVRSKIWWFRVLQFALRIAFRCVLHRCGNQDIHRLKL